MILANLWHGSWALPISANVLVGVGAPVLWTCQNDYVGRCAYQSAKEDLAHENSLSGTLAERTSEMSARLNGVFFSIYQSAGFCGNILSSVILLALQADQGVKNVLFVVL